MLKLSTRGLLAPFLAALIACQPALAGTSIPPATGGGGGGDASSANQTAVQANPGSDAAKAIAVQGVTGAKPVPTADTKLPPAGPQPSSAGITVVPPTDADAHLSGSITVADTGMTSSGGMSGSTNWTGAPTSGSAVVMSIVNRSEAVITINASSWASGSVEVRVSSDNGTTYVPTKTKVRGAPLTNFDVPTITNNGVFVLSGIGAVDHIMVIATSAPAASVSVYINATSAPGETSVNSSIGLVDKVSGNAFSIDSAGGVLVKDESTLTLFGHLGIPVYALNPNTGNPIDPTQDVNVNLDNLGGTGILNGGVGGSFAVGGMVASGGSASSVKPLIMGGRAQVSSTPPAPVTDGQAVQAMYTSGGKQVVILDAPEALKVRGSASTSGTTATELIPAQGAGIYIHVKAVQCFRTDVGTTSEVHVILNDSASTPVPIPPPTGAAMPWYPIDLEAAANTHLTFTPSTVSSGAQPTIFCSAQGFKAAE